MNVYEFSTGRPRIINPRISDFEGDAIFPAWFCAEVAPLLAASDPYAIVAGVGLICRLSPHVVPNYAQLLKSKKRNNLPVLRGLAWTTRIASTYRNHVIDAFKYEVDDLLDVFPVIKRLYERNAAGWFAQVLATKQRRDDLESVAYILSALRYSSVLIEAECVDQTARDYGMYLNAGTRQETDERLLLIRRQYPRNWWGA